MPRGKARPSTVGIGWSSGQRAPVAPMRCGGTPGSGLPSVDDEHPATSVVTIAIDAIAGIQDQLPRGGSFGQGVTTQRLTAAPPAMLA